MANPKNDHSKGNKSNHSISNVQSSVFISATLTPLLPFIWVCIVAHAQHISMHGYMRMEIVTDALILLRYSNLMSFSKIKFTQNPIKNNRRGASGNHNRIMLAVIVGIFVFWLLLIGCVERNPGPGKKGAGKYFRYMVLWK